MRVTIGRRFSWMLIGVTAVILAGFAAYAISTNVSRINARLARSLGQIATIAQRSLQTPVWNLEEATIHAILEAILASEEIVHISIATKDGTVYTRNVPLFDNKDITYFVDAPQFLVKTMDMQHEGENIGTLHLTMSRQQVQQEVWDNILRILTLMFLILLAIAVTLMLSTRRYITRPLAQLEQVATLIAQGHLDATIAIHSRDEIGRLAQALDVMQGSLKQLFEAVQQASGQVASSATQLATSSQQLDARMMDQVASTHQVVATTKEIANHMTMVASIANDASAKVETVATATEEMTATVSEIARNAEQARHVTTTAVRSVANASTRVADLNTAAQEITQVTEVIEEIADQIKLLALNATIEAARAGEAGKGFAVVANEVKELAKQTNDAIEDIRHKIDTMLQSTAETVTEIGDINQVITEVDELVSSIAVAVEEQSIAAQEIASNIVQVAGGIKEMSGTVTGAADVSQEIANDLIMVSEASGEMGAVSTEVSAQASGLDTISQELKQLIEHFHLTSETRVAGV